MIGDTFVRCAALRAAVLSAVVLLAAPVGASGACEPAGDANLVGLYQLRGVMETGSMIGLAPDGRFRYMLSVGAYDEAASGCWSRRGNRLVLRVTQFKKNAPSKSQFKRLELQLHAGGALLRRTGHNRTWRYVRVRRYR